jgi:hypothetical protein
MAYNGDESRFNPSKNQPSYPTAYNYADGSNQQASVVAPPKATPTSQPGDYQALLAETDRTASGSQNQSGYRDIIWLVLFWVHAAVIIGLACKFT